MQWLYNAYDLVDVYPKAFPKLLDGWDVPGTPAVPLE